MTAEQRILIARPGARAAALHRALATQGLVPANLDAMSLVPMVPGEALQRSLYDAPITSVVCVSPFAASQLSSFLMPRPSWLCSARWMATGHSTQQALSSLFDYPLDDILTPRAGEWAASEGLLAQPSLQELEGEHFLIARGEGGRKTLKETLQDRGATVHEVVLYRRTLQTPPTLERTWLTNGDYKALVVTSAEQLKHLLQWCSSDSFKRPLVISSQRLEATAYNCGFTHIVKAVDATPEALAETCSRLKG